MREVSGALLRVIGTPWRLLVGHLSTGGGKSEYGITGGLYLGYPDPLKFYRNECSRLSAMKTRRKV